MGDGCIFHMHEASIVLKSLHCSVDCAQLMALNVHLHDQIATYNMETMSKRLQGTDLTVNSVESRMESFNTPVSPPRDLERRVHRPLMLRGASW
jgi:hypothetical protein